MSRPLLRIVAILVGAVVVIGVAAVAAVVLLIDAPAFKPRLETVVQNATGRAFNAGALHLGLGLPPTLTAENVSLANQPGGSRPEMATIGRISSRVALLALLRGQLSIARLDLDHADILLETDAAGRANWRFAPRAPAATGPAGAESTSLPRTPRFGIGDVRITNSRLIWRDGRTGRSVAFDLPRLDVSAPSDTSPVTLSGDTVFEGRAVTFSGQTGSLARLQDLNSAEPWPAKIAMQGPGLRANVQGSLTQPLQARGYTLDVDGAADSLADLQQFVSFPLPAARDVTFSAHVADSGGPHPAISNVALHAGASDFSAFMPGLSLARLDVAMPALDQPIQVAAEAALNGTPLHIAGTAGSVQRSNKTEPYPFDLSAETAGAAFTAKGVIAAPLKFTGLDLAVSARVQDLAALTTATGTKLPALTPLSFDGRVTDAEGGLVHGATLHGFTLTMPAGDLAGDLTFAPAPRPSLRGSLATKHLDLDALTRAFASVTSVTTPAATSAGRQGEPPKPAPPAEPPRLIPDTPLPLRWLLPVDADLQLTAGELIYRSLPVHSLATHVALLDGRLTLDPFAATLPGGNINLHLDVNARAPSPPIALTLHAPAIELKPLLTALSLPDDVGGTGSITADLRGQGATPRAIASALDGTFGLAMGEGEIDNRILGVLLGEVLRTVRVPPDAATGRTRLRCLALRMEATHGNATLSPLVLDTTRVLVQGTGSLNLADEGLQLRLRPLIRAGRPGVVVPVRVGGTLLHPKATVDTAGTLDSLANLLSRQAAGAERGADACAPALAAARFEPGTAAPAPQATPQPAAPVKPPKPVDILRNLLR
jgi:AsmA protein